MTQPRNLSPWQHRNKLSPRCFTTAATPQALQQVLQGQQALTQLVAQAVARLEAGQARLEAGQARLEFNTRALHVNGMALPNTPLLWLMNAQGQVPNAEPVTIQQLQDHGRAAEVDGYFNHYQLPIAGDIFERKRVLLRHLGARA